MIKIISRLFFLVFLFSLLIRFFPLAGCGASPPASIPAPVANFATVGGPSGTTISGTVQPNSLVTGANLSAGGSTTQRRQNLFLKNAYAQTPPYGQTNADGAGIYTFTNFPASANDDVGIRYRNPLGEISEQLIIKIPCGGAGVQNPPGTPDCVGTITP